MQNPPDSKRLRGHAIPSTVERLRGEMRTLQDVQSSSGFAKVLPGLEGIQEG